MNEDLNTEDTNVSNTNATEPVWMQALKNADYIDFAKSVKQEINSRIAQHPFVKDIETRNNYYTNLSNYFAGAPVNADAPTEEI